MGCFLVVIMNNFLSIYFVADTGLRTDPIVNSHKPLRWVLRPSSLPTAA